jgi:hypothetical protein
MTGISEILQYVYFANLRDILNVDSLENGFVDRIECLQWRTSR